MKKIEKQIREKKWNTMKNIHRYNSMNGGYYFDQSKGFITKYNSTRDKKTFKKVNSHYKRQRIRSLLAKGDFENLSDKIKIDIWGWD